MAKSRRLTTSRSELYLGTYGFNPGQQTVNGSPELGEDEVWSTVHDETVNAYESNGTNFQDPYAPRRRPPRRSDSSSAGSLHRPVGGLSLAFDGTGSPGIAHQFHPQDGGGAENSPRERHMAASAPVNVPDWSRICRVGSDVNGFDDDDDDESNREAEIVPPHEYLARSRGTAFEGVGLSLKGRNLSRVRDAVWSQTGFYG